jgi:hypothetical protein
MRDDALYKWAGRVCGERARRSQWLWVLLKAAFCSGEAAV